MDRLVKMIPHSDYAGYSQREMWLALNDTFGEGSPIQLRPLTDEECAATEIYFLREIRSLGIAVICGRKIVGFVELTLESADRSEARASGDILDRQAGLVEQLHGLLKPQGVDVIGEYHSETGVERIGKRGKFAGWSRRM